MSISQISILIAVLGILVASIAFFWGTSHSTKEFIKIDNRTSNVWKDFWIGMILLALALIFPAFGAGKYLLSQIVLFFIWAAVVTQWNLIFGIAGIFTLGHMAVFAVGGYITSMIAL